MRRRHHSPAFLVPHVARLFRDSRRAHPIRALLRPYNLRVVGEHNSVGIALARCEAAHVAAVMRDLRQMVDPLAAEAGFAFTDPQLLRLVRDDPMADLLCLASGSGHVRQKGLERVSVNTGQFPFAMVIHCLNDWVPEVRSAACDALLRLISADQKKDRPALKYSIASCAALLLDADRYTRMTGAGKDVVAKLLAHPGVPDALQHNLLAPSPSATGALRAMLRHRRIGSELAEIAQGSKNATRRLIAVRAILQNHYSWREDGVTRTVHFAFGGGTAEVLESALNDPARPVADFARRYA